MKMLIPFTILVLVVFTSCTSVLYQEAQQEDDGFIEDYEDARMKFDPEEVCDAPSSGLNRGQVNCLNRGLTRILQISRTFASSVCLTALVNYYFIHVEFYSRFVVVRLIAPPECAMNCGTTNGIPRNLKVDRTLCVQSKEDKR